MADDKQPSGRESLMEREREALQILAREMVRKAGLVREPEKDATEKRVEDMIETYRIYTHQALEFFKHMMTLSSASIVALRTVYRAVLTDVYFLWMLYISLGFLVTALIWTGVVFGMATRAIGGPPGGWNWRDKTTEQLLEKAGGNTRFWNRNVQIVLYLWLGGVLTFVTGFIFQLQ